MAAVATAPVSSSSGARNCAVPPSPFSSGKSPAPAAAVAFESTSSLTKTLPSCRSKMSRPASKLLIPPPPSFLCRVMPVFACRCCKLPPLAAASPLCRAAICASSSAMSFAAIVLPLRCRSPVVLVGSFATGTTLNWPLTLEAGPSSFVALLEPPFFVVWLETLSNEDLWLAVSSLVDSNGCSGGRAATATRGFRSTPSSGRVPSMRPAASYSSVHAESSKMFSPLLRLFAGGLGLGTPLDLGLWSNMVRAETSLVCAASLGTTWATGTSLS
mmetsp:Transcript_996/g.2195  ORF Transcript_996/g.2195 Transcript_996/m.2195 type:complete len:272 (+) Transcript_996:278-1093(+)